MKSSGINSIQANSQPVKSQTTDRSGKLVGQIVSNKGHTGENQTLNHQTSKPKKEEVPTKSENQIPTISSDAKPSKNHRQSQVTEEPEPLQEESQIENDIFLSESVGIDVSVDSIALRQFDYNESVDLNN